MKYISPDKTFSIITAVYNGQDYIANCIETIASSNYDLEKIEHIIIDDGSTDNTKGICEELAKKYSHVKFYSKPNGHWGSVMNYVKNKHLVHNDYIKICDVDDFLSSDAFNVINTKCDDADIVATNFTSCYGKRRKLIIPPYFFMFKRRMHKKHQWHYYSNLILPQTAWVKNKIFYSIPNLREGCAYQDGQLFTYANLLANEIRYISKSTFTYMANRENNTRSILNLEKGAEALYKNNYRDYEKNGWITPFFFAALGFKSTRKYFKKHNITLNFTGCKLELSGWPWYVRLPLRILYLVLIKRFIKK